MKTVKRQKRGQARRIVFKNAANKIEDIQSEFSRSRVMSMDDPAGRCAACEVFSTYRAPGTSVNVRATPESVWESRPATPALPSFASKVLRPADWTSFHHLAVSHLKRRHLRGKPRSKILDLAAPGHG